MSQSKSVTAFSRAASSFDVHESDYLVLLSDRVSTFEAMAFRFPKEQDFEDYVKRYVRPQGGYQEEDGSIKVYDKTSPPLWEDFKSSEDCGCLRKLWHMASQVAKKELETLVAGTDESTTSKMNAVLSLELEEKAILSGMPAPSSDKERPSLHTLGKVQGNFSPGGHFQHISWESYVDAETEGRLRRAGKLPRDKTELVLREDKVSARNKESELQSTVDIKDTAGLREALEIRARCFHMVGVADYFVVRKLTEKFVSLLRQTALEGMRQPTLNEVRRTDRLIFEEILKWVSKGQGTVDAGLNHYLSSPQDMLWNLCKQQPESFPDQGLERSAPESSSRKRSLADAEKTDENKKDKTEKPAPDKEKVLRLCLVCKKRHEPLCPLPEGWRREQRAKAKEAKKAWQEKKGKGEKK